MTRAETMPLQFESPVTLVGGGFLDAAMLAEAQALAPVLVAADGAADRLAAMGLTPAAVIGDMDSLSPVGRAAARRLVALDEQETTDFEKCLYATEAPLYLAAGFTGIRLDHTLAALHALMARPAKRVVILGEAEAMALAPAGRELRFELAAGARVSVYPLGPVSGRSTGLRWPLDGQRLAPGERIGTSNEALGGLVTLHFDARGALVILERPALPLLARQIAAEPASAPG